MELFWYLGAVWVLRIQMRYAVRFMCTMHGNNWPHGLRFEDGNHIQLGCDQQLMGEALSQHAAVLRCPFNQHLGYGTPRLDRDQRGKERLINEEERKYGKAVYWNRIGREGNGADK